MAAIMSEQLACALVSIEQVVKFSEGFPVFPCRRQAEEVTVRGERVLRKAKSPLTMRGLLDATQDVAQIRAWWRRWPDALVGVPTGNHTRLLVVDYDVQKATPETNEWISAHSHELLATRTHQTLNGGRHYLFRTPEGAEFRNGVDITAGGIKRRGLDVRAEGGYIVWWPMHGARTSGAIAPLPAGLVDEHRLERRELPPLPPHSPAEWARERVLAASALAYLSPDDYGSWSRCGLALHLASGGSDDGFQLWHAWSAGEITGDVPHNYSGINDCRYHWSSYRHDKDRAHLVTLGTLFQMAKERGWVRPAAPKFELPPIEGYAQDAAVEQARAAAKDQPIARLTQSAEEARSDNTTFPAVLDWAALNGKAVPERQWAIKGWLGFGHVTLLAGREGTGKTAVAQAIASHVSLSYDCVDTVLEPCTTLCWFGEDDVQELWRRQVAIANLMGVGLDAFAGKLHIAALDQEDITLVAPLDGKMTVQPRLLLLREQIGDLRARVVIIDSVARTFAGNENSRHDVTSYLTALNWALAPTGAAVLLIGHPSKATGSEYSGSTAWAASVRSRWYFGRQLPKAGMEEEAEKDEGDSPLRYLAKRKANYSTRDTRLVKWIDGVMMPQTPDPGAPVRSARRPAFLAEETLTVFRRLHEIGIKPTHAPNSQDYLPRAAQNAGLLTDELAFGDVKAGLSELLKSGRLVVGVIGKYAKGADRLGLLEV